MCLIKFVQRVPVLYGEQFVSYNVHLMLHLPKSVLQWGPLWGTSAFIFKDCYGKLLSLYHGTQDVLTQMSPPDAERTKSNFVSFEKNAIEVLNK